MVIDKDLVTVQKNFHVKLKQKLACKALYIAYSDLFILQCDSTGEWMQSAFNQGLIHLQVSEITLDTTCSRCLPLVGGSSPSGPKRLMDLRSHLCYLIVPVAILS